MEHKNKENAEIPINRKGRMQYFFLIERLLHFFLSKDTVIIKKSIKKYLQKVDHEIINEQISFKHIY